MCRIRRHTQLRAVGLCSFFFFFNDTATTEIYTLSLHDALPICEAAMCSLDQPAPEVVAQVDAGVCGLGFAGGARRLGWLDAREVACAVVVVALDLAVGQFAGHDAPLAEIGRASCRERV